MTASASILEGKKNLNPSIVSITAPRPSISFFHATWVLAQRETVRFFRQRSRVIGSFLPPLLFWAMMGIGFQSSFSPAGQEDITALHFFFPGTLALVILFSAIFSTITIIEDRKEGFLQSMITSPAPRSAIVCGKVLGAGWVAFVQGMLMSAAYLFWQQEFSWQAVGYLTIALGATALALTALGFLIAWKMESTHGFHTIMNLLLMPMWFLSGALFPLEGAPRWLEMIMRLNPLTYFTGALRYGINGFAFAGYPSSITALTISLLATVLVILAAIGICHREETI